MSSFFSDFPGQGPHLLHPDRRRPSFYTDVSGISQLVADPKERLEPIIPSGEHEIRHPSEIAKGLGLDIGTQTSLERAASDWIAAPDLISFRKSVMDSLRTFAPQNYGLRNEIARRANTLWKASRSDYFSRKVGFEGERMVVQKSFYDYGMDLIKAGDASHKKLAKTHKTLADKHMGLMMAASSAEEKAQHQKAFMEHMVAHNMHKQAALAAPEGAQSSAIKKQAVKVATSAHRASVPVQKRVAKRAPAVEMHEVKVGEHRAAMLEHAKAARATVGDFSPESLHHRNVQIGAESMHRNAIDAHEKASDHLKAHGADDKYYLLAANAQKASELAKQHSQTAAQTPSTKPKITEDQLRALLFPKKESSAPVTEDAPRAPKPVTAAPIEPFSDVALVHTEGPSQPALVDELTKQMAHHRQQAKYHSVQASEFSKKASPSDPKQRGSWHRLNAFMEAYRQHEKAQGMHDGAYEAFQQARSTLSPYHVADARKRSERASDASREAQDAETHALSLPEAPPAPKAAPKPERERPFFQGDWLGAMRPEDAAEYHDHVQQAKDHEAKAKEHREKGHGSALKQVGQSHLRAAESHSYAQRKHEAVATQLKSHFEHDPQATFPYNSTVEPIAQAEAASKKAHQASRDAELREGVTDQFSGQVKERRKPPEKVTDKDLAPHRQAISDLNFIKEAVQRAGDPIGHVKDIDAAIMAHQDAIRASGFGVDAFKQLSEVAHELSDGVKATTGAMGAKKFGELEDRLPHHASEIEHHQDQAEQHEVRMKQLKRAMMPQSLKAYTDAAAAHRKALDAHRKAHLMIMDVNAQPPKASVEEYHAANAEAEALSNQAYAADKPIEDIHAKEADANVEARREYHDPMRAFDRPPPGFTSIPNSKKGGYHKRVGDRYIYWYPDGGIGVHPRNDDSPKVHAFHAQIREAQEKGLTLPEPPKGRRAPKSEEDREKEQRAPEEASGVLRHPAGEPAPRGRLGAVAPADERAQKELAIEAADQKNASIPQLVETYGTLPPVEGHLPEVRKGPSKESIVKARTDYAELLPDIPEDVKLPDSLKHFPRPAPLIDSQGHVKGYIADAADHQVEGAERILAAWKDRDGMLLQDDAGLGKTVTALLAAVQRNGKRTLIVVPTSGKEGLKRQWRGERNAGLFNVDVKSLEDGIHPTEPGVYMVSYDELLLKEKELDAATGKQQKKLREEIFSGDGWDTLIFDECHNLIGRGERARAAKRLMDRSQKCLYMSATPYTNITDMHYLTKLGLGFSSNWDTFAQWADSVGAEVKGQNVKNPKSLLPFAAIAATLHVDGASIKRSASLDGCHNTFKVIDSESLNPLQRKAFLTAHQILDTAKGAVDDSILRALYIGWSKQYWETLKVDRAVELGKKALAEGKQVAFFTSFKASNHKHLRAIPRMMYDEADRREGSALERGFTDPKVQKLRIAADEITELIKQLPPGESVVDQLTQAFGGPKQVAEIHGNTRKKPADEQDAYQAGQKKVCVATMARGGTGISLHDTTGEAPRVQINLSLPWSGREYSQVAGRSHRLGSKSETEMHWLLGDDDHERHIANIVGDRLVKAGALATGDIGQTPDAESMMRFEFAGQSSRSNSDDVDDDIKAIAEAAKLAEEQAADDEKGTDADGEKYESRKTVSNYFEEFAKARKSGRDVLKERQEARQTAKDHKTVLEGKRAAAQILGTLESHKQIPYRPDLGGFVFTKVNVPEAIFRAANSRGQFHQGLYAVIVPPEKMPAVAKAAKVHEVKIDMREVAAKEAEAQKLFDPLHLKGIEALKKHSILVSHSTQTVGGQPVYLVHGNTRSNAWEIKNGAKDAGHYISFDYSNKTWPVPAEALPAVVDKIMETDSWRKSFIKSLVIPRQSLDALLDKARVRFQLREAQNPGELVWCAEAVPDELHHRYQLQPPGWGPDALTKGASHKYIKRVPTGNPARPYRYWYRLPNGEITSSTDIKRGSKFKVAHQGMEGHFEVLKHDRQAGLVHIKHDESGRTLRVKADTLHGMVRDYHEAKRMAEEKAAKKAARLAAKQKAQPPSGASEIKPVAPPAPSMKVVRPMPKTVVSPMAAAKGQYHQDFSAWHRDAAKVDPIGRKQHLAAAEKHEDAAALHNTLTGYGKDAGLKKKALAASAKAEEATSAAKVAKPSAPAEVSGPKADFGQYHQDVALHHREAAKKEPQLKDQHLAAAEKHEDAAALHNAHAASGDEGLKAKALAASDDAERATSSAVAQKVAGPEVMAEPGKPAEVPSVPEAQAPASEPKLSREKQKEQNRQDHQAAQNDHAEQARLHDAAIKITDGEAQTSHRLAAKLHRAATKAHSTAVMNLGKQAGPRYQMLARKAENSSKLAETSTEKANAASGPGKGIDQIHAEVKHAEAQADIHRKALEAHAKLINTGAAGEHYHSRAKDKHMQAVTAWGTVARNYGDKKTKAYAEKASEKAYRESELSGLDVPKMPKAAPKPEAPLSAPAAEAPKPEATPGPEKPVASAPAKGSIADRGYDVSTRKGIQDEARQKIMHHQELATAHSTARLANMELDYKKHERARKSHVKAYRAWEAVNQAPSNSNLKAAAEKATEEAYASSRKSGKRMEGVPGYYDRDENSEHAKQEKYHQEKGQQYVEAAVRHKSNTPEHQRAMELAQNHHEAASAHGIADRAKQLDPEKYEGLKNTAEQATAKAHAADQVGATAASPAPAEPAQSPEAPAKQKDHLAQENYHREKAREHQAKVDEAKATEKNVRAAHLEAAAQHHAAASAHSIAHGVQVRPGMVHPYTGEYYSSSAQKADEATKKAEKASQIAEKTVAPKNALIEKHQAYRDKHSAQFTDHNSKQFHENVSAMEKAAHKVALEAHRTALRGHGHVITAVEHGDSKPQGWIDDAMRSSTKAQEASKNAERIQAAGPEVHAAYDEHQRLKDHHTDEAARFKKLAAATPDSNGLHYTYQDAAKTHGDAVEYHAKALDAAITDPDFYDKASRAAHAQTARTHERSEYANKAAGTPVAPAAPAQAPEAAPAPVITENAPAVNHDQQAAYHKQKATEHSQAAKSATGPEKQAHFAAAAAHGEAVSDHKDAAYTQSRSPNPYEQVHPFTGEHYNIVAGKAGESSRKAEQMSAATKQAAAAPAPAEAPAPAPAGEAQAPSLPLSPKKLAHDQKIRPDLLKRAADHGNAKNRHQAVYDNSKDVGEREVHREALVNHRAAEGAFKTAWDLHRNKTGIRHARTALADAETAAENANGSSAIADKYSDHHRFEQDHRQMAQSLMSQNNYAQASEHDRAANAHNTAKLQIRDLRNPNRFESKQAYTLSDIIGKKEKEAPAPAPAVEAPSAAPAPAAMPAQAPASAPVEVPADFKKYAAEVKAHQKAAAKQHKMAGAPGLDPRVAAEYARARDVHQQAAEHYQRAMRDGDYNALNEARRVGNADIRATEKQHRKIAADHLERGNAAKTPEEGAAHMDAYAQHLAAAEGHKVAFEMANPDLKANAQSMSDAAHQASRQLMNAPAAPAPMPEAPAAPAPAPEVPSADMAHQNRVQSAIAEHNRLAEEHGQKAGEHAQLAQSGTPSQQAGHQNAANEHAAAQDQHQRAASDWERNHEMYRNSQSGLSSQVDFHSQRAHAASREAVNPGSTDYVPKINHQQIGWALKDQQAEHINHAAKNEYPEAKQAAHSDAARAFREAHEANQAAHDLYNAPRGEFNPRAYRAAVDHARNLTSQAEGLGEMAHGMPQTAPAPDQEEDDIPITVEEPSQQASSVNHRSSSEYWGNRSLDFENNALQKTGRKERDAYQRAAMVAAQASHAQALAHKLQSQNSPKYPEAARRAEALSGEADMMHERAKGSPSDHFEQSRSTYKEYANLHRQTAAKQAAAAEAMGAGSEKTRLAKDAKLHQKAAEHYGFAHHYHGQGADAKNGYEIGNHASLDQAKEHQILAQKHRQSADELSQSVNAGAYKRTIEAHQEAAAAHDSAARNHFSRFENITPFKSKKEQDAREQNTKRASNHAFAASSLALSSEIGPRKMSAKAYRLHALDPWKDIPSEYNKPVQNESEGTP